MEVEEIPLALCRRRLFIGVVMSAFSNLERLRAAYAVSNARSDCGQERRFDHASRLDVTTRMRRGQLDLMDMAAKTIFGNLFAGIIVAFVIRHDVSLIVLAAWLVGLAVVSWGLFERVKWHKKQNTSEQLPLNIITCRLNEHAAFSVAVGLVWGLFIIWCGPALPDGNLVIISLIVIGCISVTVSAIGPSLPVFFGFFFATLPALIYANFMQTSPNGRLYAFLLTLYGVALIVNVLTFNRSVLSALRQRAKNELLADSLALAEAATDAAMRSKWASFAHLSHELRTPMNAVLGFSDMMRQQMFGTLSPRYLDYAQSIYGSGRDALTIIDSILEVSRARTGEMTLAESRFDPAILAHELVQEFTTEAKEADISISVNIRQPGTGLYADRIKIGQVLHNLMSNALHYTRPGGRITLDLSYADEGFCLTVSDTGVGIAADEIALCQEPFVRLGDPLISRANGAGLGLPIAKHLLEAHGGSLSIESRLGHGTSVTFLLPSSRCVPLTGEDHNAAPELPFLRLVHRD